MTKRVRIGIILVLCLVAVTWMFPFSSLSMYKSVSYKSDPVFIENYKNEIEEFEKIHERGEGLDRIQSHTNYLLDELYGMDLMIATKDRVTMNDLDHAFNTVRNMNTTLIRFSFDEELSKESREYLELSIYECLIIQDAIRELKGPHFYTRFQLKNLISNLQYRISVSFEKYSHFYLAHYGVE